MTNPQQTLSSMVKYWKLSSKVRKKTRVPTFTTNIQHSFGSFGHSNQSIKRNKRNPNWKRRSKKCHCLQMTRWYKDAIRKLLELITEFIEVAGYKINTQKSLAFLYTNNERSEREIKETISFTITSKKIKFQEYTHLRRQKTYT